MRRREFLLPLFWRVTAAFSALASGMICLRLYGRYLDPSAFGVVVVALQILNYLPMLDGGFRLTVNRLILAGTDAAERRRLLGFYQTLQFYISLIALALGVAGMSGYWGVLLAQHRTAEPPEFFLILAVVGALAVGSGLQSGLLIGLRAQEQTFLLNSVNAWANVVVLWLCLRRGWGVWAFPLAMLVTMSLNYVLAVALIRRREPTLNFWGFRLSPEFRELFRQHRASAWTCFRSQLVTMLLYTVDLVLVELLCGPAEAGVYAVLSRVFTMLRAFLLSSGEVTWPMVAQRGSASGGFQNLLTRGNAWMYGSVAGPVCVTLVPFCQWYVGKAWTTNDLVVALMAGRFLITGLATPAAYVLYGLGEFRVLTRYLERELIVGVMLAVVLGLPFGLAGVTAAFLLATAFGTLYPLIRAYAQQSRENVQHVLRQMWWRALIGFGYSFICAWTLWKSFPTGIWTLIPATVGVLSGLLLAVVISFIRFRPIRLLFAKPGGFTQLLKRI